LIGQSQEIHIIRNNIFKWQKIKENKKKKYRNLNLVLIISI
jgi:hypothetical protein